MVVSPPDVIWRGGPISALNSRYSTVCLSIRLEFCVSLSSFLAAMGFIANQGDLIITVIILTSTTMLAVGARFYARHRLRAKHGLDDWCTLAAGVLFWVDNIFLWWAVRNNYQGIDPLAMTLTQLQIALKTIFAGIFLLSTILTLCRLSIIFLYDRLFGVYQNFRKILIAYGIVSVAWLITVWIAIIFRCKPVKGSWDLTSNPRCAFSIQTFFLSMESLNAALDITLVVLPISKIKNLHLPLKERIGLGVVFLLGGFVGLTSVLRIVISYKPTKKDSIIDSIFWLWLQLASAIICACLPTLRPLLPTKKFFGRVPLAAKQLLRTDIMTYSRSRGNNQSNKSGPTEYGISMKSDDEIALTGIDGDIHTRP